jgi:hypothetical protein
MDNRLIFLYHVPTAITDGGTGSAMETQAMVVLGQPRRAGDREIRHPLSLRRDAEVHNWTEVPEAMPPRKASREVGRARTKTDTGGQVENTKAIGRTLVKELGKMAP